MNSDCSSRYHTAPNKHIHKALWHMSVRYRALRTRYNLLNARRAATILNFETLYPESTTILGHANPLTAPIAPTLASIATNPSLYRAYLSKYEKDFEFYKGRELVSEKMIEAAYARSHMDWEEAKRCAWTTGFGEAFDNAEIYLKECGFFEDFS
ncbi:hypothetical protein BJ508DRAFT_333848 [Ascobolus immersus RN42]|uniref:Uncharacterized protein n=1 Tax=Ascobolus immersus RN42 TaxID=1160509 RepID=A0A3N4HVN2_ASCIM|nr:hypothetical protein BJ508DRAFT_333848 [Ascobolus immersus RN42]